MPLQWVSDGNIVGAIINVVFEQLAGVVDELSLLEALLTVLEDLAVEYAWLFELFVFPFEFLQLLDFGNFAGEVQWQHWDFIIIVFTALHVFI